MRGDEWRHGVVRMKSGSTRNRVRKETRIVRTHSSPKMSSRRSPAAAQHSAKELLVQALQPHSSSSSSTTTTTTTTTSLKHVARVLALLPELSGEAAAPALLVPRHQATVLMCAELARSSVRHAKKLLPALLRVLALVPRCDTRNVYSTQVTQGAKEKEKEEEEEEEKKKKKKNQLFVLERFVEALIRELLHLAARHPSTSESVQMQAKSLLYSTNLFLSLDLRIDHSSRRRSCCQCRPSVAISSSSSFHF
jgi:hypothetical protein